MKLPWLLIPLGFYLCSCKEKPAPLRTEPAATMPAAVDAEPSPQTPAPKHAALPVKATPQQLGSLLRVRVAFGGLPPQDSAAALLHREEILIPALVQGNDRFVLAMLKGWEEAQLRSPSGRIVVYRNKVNARGETVTGAYPGRLVQFDAASGLALLTYTDTFEYSADVGFHLERSVRTHAALPLLRTFSDGEPASVTDPRMLAPRPPAMIPAAPRAQPFSSDAGLCRWSAGARSVVEMPALTSRLATDTVHLAVGPPDRLIAFVEEAPDRTAAVTAVDKFVANPSETTSATSKNNAAPGMEKHGEAGAATPFPLEAAVRSVALMAGGREALLELQGAPFWKRFSFEKNDWLPLPEGDLSSVHMAGNLSALFVLDRNTGEVRKYALNDLKSASAATLPPSTQYLAIFAGCNTDHAPVQVLTENDALALRPETLERRNFQRFSERGARLNFDRNMRVSMSGDGLSLMTSGPKANGSHTYNSDTRGLEFKYFDTRGFSTVFPGVCGAYDTTYGLKCIATPGGEPSAEWKLPTGWSSATRCLAANCPVLFCLQREDLNVKPPRPPKLGLFSFFDTSPFAEVEVPELAALKTHETWKGDRPVFFDPYSMRLATLSEDSKTWLVRKLDVSEKRDQPILLNWPDTSFARGGEFRFRPLLLGGKSFSAEIYGAPKLAGVNEAEGTVGFPVPANDFASLRLLTLKVPGKDGSELSYPIPLHTLGPELPIAVPPAANRKLLNSSGTGFKAMTAPTSRCRVLPATVHLFADPIFDLLGPVSDCLALVATTNKVDFFSLQTRKIVGSIVGPVGAHYFAGAGALFEYDAGKRTLTRIAVPAGKREQVLDFPANVELTAIGMGTETESPLTLVVQVREGKESVQLGDLKITCTYFHTVVTVRDGRTLQSTGWAQPVSFDQMLKKREAGDFAARMSVGSREWPRTLPASHNGRVVNFPAFFLALSPAYAIAYPYANQESNEVLNGGNLFQPGGSISGLMAVSAGGFAFKAGSPVGGQFDAFRFGGTPCGRYLLTETQSGGEDGDLLEIRLAENNQPLLLGARFSFLGHDSLAGQNLARRVTMLGDSGPLALFDESSHVLQLVEFNIPELTKELVPDVFHVTSQPVPCISEGAAMQYQVRVNNPDAVASYRLQRPVPGAQLSPQGLLQFTAPTKIAEPTQRTFSIEVIGKKGQVILHEFPIHILPAAPANGPAKIGPTI